MAEPPVERESLRELRRAVRLAFPEPEHAELIDLYIGELAHVMDPAPAGSLSDARHDATSLATQEDAVTLLCKLEGYLESILVGRTTARSEA